MRQISLDRDFVARVCNAFEKAVESASGPTLEGREREFRRGLARYLFDDILGWEGHSKFGEIYDITCLDDENFPVIDVETKWNVEQTNEIKEKLRKRVEELGSVRYGIFANERDFIVYEYSDYKLREMTRINVSEAIGVAKGKYGLSDDGRKRIVRLELIKREHLTWTDKSEYLEKTYKEVSVAQGDGVKLLTDNLKSTVGELTDVLTDFFNSYWKRKNHYSNRFLENTFKDWLKLSTKSAEFEKDWEKKKGIIDIFCRETAYVLLGRILFIRICEDKDIIESTISGKGIAEALEYFRKRGIGDVYLRLFNDSREEIKKYYGHLNELGFFDWWILEEVKRGTLPPEDESTQKTLERSLDSSIGKAFRRLNRFDFSKVNRDILGDVYQGYLSVNERRRLGEFYTPKEIIEYILDSVGYKPENEIRARKLLDPSCGSGGFLVEASQRLIERYRRIGFNLTLPEDSKQVIEGCVDSIYGLDIHPFASFIAEMNLLFQFIDLYDVVKQKDRQYKIPRINIYRTDSLAPTGKLLELTDFLENSRRKMVVDETKGSDKVKHTEFYFVVGNPPYVRKELIFPNYKKDVLERVFSNIFNGDNDLSVYFISRGIEWLTDGGRLGYIVSRKFLKTRYGEKIRGVVPTTSSIEEYIDFEKTEVFKEATNYPCIIVLRKENNAILRQENQVKVAIVKKEAKTANQLLENIKRNINKEEYSDDFVEIFRFPQSRLNETQWEFSPSKSRNVYDKIAKSTDCTLADFVLILSGIKTGKEKVYVIDQQTADGLLAEKDLLKPVLRGEDIKRYRLTYRNKYLVFPYQKFDGKYVVVDISRHPQLHEFLGKYKEELAQRYDIKNSGSKWYELRSCAYYPVFDSEKIVYPDISDRSNFTYDEEGFYCLMTAFVIAMKEEYKKEPSKYLKYLLGLLNSKVLEFYFRKISTFIRGGYYRYKTQYLSRLPIKGLFPENKVFIERIVSLVDELLTLNRNINSTERKLEGFPQSYVESDWASDRLIDLVKGHSLTRDTYIISPNSLRTDYKQSDLDGTETFRVILATEEQIHFSREDAATYVLEILKKTKIITKRELLELRIPQKPHLKLLLNQRRNDVEQIARDKKKIAEIDRRVDDLVYELYDINYSERKVIENQLK